MKQMLVSVRYCVKGWQISTATGATVSFSFGGSLGNPAVPVVMKMKKGAFASEENPKLYKYLERGKGTVCHAWEDKEDFVDEFVGELKKQGIKVWYDTNKLKWGDSMREKIDKGLAKSRYGVVVLSPNYIAEHKYWTKAELNGLFQVESINGKVILPIWHNLTKKQVVEYSPIIADRKAMTTASMTAEEIAVQLKELFTPEVTEEN